jgi:hypothetical protein
MYTVSAEGYYRQKQGESLVPVGYHFGLEMNSFGGGAANHLTTVPPVLELLKLQGSILARKNPTEWFR